MVEDIFLELSKKQINLSVGKYFNERKWKLEDDLVVK